MSLIIQVDIYSSFNIVLFLLKVLLHLPFWNLENTLLIFQFWAFLISLFCKFLVLCCDIWMLVDHIHGQYCLLQSTDHLKFQFFLSISTAITFNQFHTLLLESLCTLLTVLPYFSPPSLSPGISPTTATTSHSFSIQIQMKWSLCNFTWQSTYNSLKLQAHFLRNYSCPPYEFYLV